MVHSHGVRGGVVNQAPMTLGSSSMVGGWGTSGLHGRLHEFVKRALLQQLVLPGAAVCDLFCGRGTDTANWAQAGIGNYIGIDLSASALEEAKEQWEKHCRPFPATFQELDPCTGNLEILQDAGLPVDVVTCFAHLQDYFASEDMVRLLLRNVVSLLKPGGYFFGTTPDSSTIWYKYQKAVEEAMKVGSLRVNGTLPRVRSSLYTITFEDDRGPQLSNQQDGQLTSEDELQSRSLVMISLQVVEMSQSANLTKYTPRISKFQFFGSKYQLRFVDGLPAQMQQLVHFPSFIRLAEEVGLEFVEIQNLTEFYDDYRVPFASTLQSSCKNLLDQKGQPMVDSRGKLSMVATDVLSLYSTFIFKKSTRVVRPASNLDFHLGTEYQFERDLEESSPKSDSPPEMSFGFELTPETTPRDSSTRSKTREFSLFSGEYFLSSQEDLFDMALPKEGSPMYIGQDSASPTGRIETLHPQQVTDTPNFDQCFPVVTLPSVTDQQLYFQEIECVTANNNAADQERDRSATIPPDRALEIVQEQLKQDVKETVEVAGKETHQHLEDEMPHEGNLLTTHDEVAASSERTATPRMSQVKGKKKKKAKKKKKRNASFCPTAIEAVSRQMCSVNYQSEVEEEALESELEVSGLAPPPFLFYQRKKRTETGVDDVLVPEASFSTNTGSLRELRPRRPSSSVDDPKRASAVTKGPRSSKVDKDRVGNSNNLILNEDEPGGFSSEGALAGGRGGRVRGKAKAGTPLRDNQLPSQVPHDAVANGRRSTRSCSSNLIQGNGDGNKGTTSESSPMLMTRMTRMRSSNLRSSF